MLGFEQLLAANATDTPSSLMLPCSAVDFEIFLRGEAAFAVSTPVRHIAGGEEAKEVGSQESNQRVYMGDNLSFKLRWRSYRCAAAVEVAQQVRKRFTSTPRKPRRRLVNWARVHERTTRSAEKVRFKLP